MIIYCLLLSLCAEQGIDRETLLTLSSSGSIEQFSCCGLFTVKDQLKLKRLVAAADQHSGEIKVTPVSKQVAVATTCSSSGVSCTDKPKGKKLTRAEIKNLDPNDKRVYLMMYVSVCICIHI